jgi:hypothetical protein
VAGHQLHAILRSPNGTALADAEMMEGEQWLPTTHMRVRSSCPRAPTSPTSSGFELKPDPWFTAAASRSARSRSKRITYFFRKGVALPVL